ncbi:MAG: TadE/TadG family type IV pilus assembly protein [Bryobacteraceae bacterium]
MRERRNHGGATIEFALVCPFLVSLIIGTMMYGTELVKELEVQQIARDTASMTARGTNFNTTANQTLVARLAGVYKI